MWMPKTETPQVQHYIQQSETTTRNIMKLQHFWSMLVLMSMRVIPTKEHLWMTQTVLKVIWLNRFYSFSNHSRWINSYFLYSTKWKNCWLTVEPGVEDMDPAIVNSERIYYIMSNFIWNCVASVSIILKIIPSKKQTVFYQKFYLFE